MFDVMTMEIYVTFDPSLVKLEESRGTHYFILAGLECGLLPPVEQSKQTLDDLLHYIEERFKSLEAYCITPIEFHRSFPKFAENYGEDYAILTSTEPHHIYDNIVYIDVISYSKRQPIAHILFNDDEYEEAHKVVGVIKKSVNNLIKYLSSIIPQEGLQD